MLKVLHRTDDGFGSIVVTENGNKRVLSFASDFQQSAIYINKPWQLVHEYTQIMLLGLAFTQAKNIILLGLGGGGLVHCLNYFYPQMKLEVVEIRQAVIDVAYKWFDLPDTNNINLHCRDANDYIKQVVPANADIIFSDLYEAQGMSEVQTQNDFISACARALNENGWLVINFHKLPDKNSSVMQQLSICFSEIFYCDIFKGNWVVFCGKAHAGFNARKTKASGIKTSKLKTNEIKERVIELGVYVNSPIKYYFNKIKTVKF